MKGEKAKQHAGNAGSDTPTQAGTPGRLRCCQQHPDGVQGEPTGEKKKKKNINVVSRCGAGRGFNPQPRCRPPFVLQGAVLYFSNQVNVKPLTVCQSTPGLNFLISMF